MERARVVCEVDPPPPSEIVALHTRLSGDPEKGELSHPETIGEARGTEPNRLKHLLAGDLDAIVMKALMKDPQERYASVEMMSQDIGRYLGRLPVTARPMTPLYWASRLVVRRPAEVFAGSVVTILIASMAAFYTSRLQGERDVAALEAEKAEQVASFLSGIFEVGDVRAASGAGLTVTARELLDNGARRIQRELADQPDVRSSLMVTIADAYESLGLHTEAGALLDSTYAIRREFYGPDHAEVGSALNELGNSLWDRGSYDSAQALQERALAVRLTALPGGHPDIAESYNDLGKVLQEKAEYDSAGALFQTAVELYRAQRGDARANVAALLLNQAQIADIRNDIEASVEFNQEAVDISRTLETESLPNDLSTALHNLAISLEARDEGDDQRAAEQLLRESIEVVERRLGPDQPINGVTLISLGRLAESRGATGEAEALYREGLELEVKYYGGAHPNVAYDLTTLANLIRKTGQPDEARGHYERAIEIARATLEPTSPFLARPLAAYGDLLSELGELVPADETLSEAFPIAVNAVGGDHPFTLTIKASLGSLRGRQERFAEGERLLLEAWAPFVASADGDDPRVRSLSLRFVEFYEAWDRPEEADRYRNPD